MNLSVVLVLIITTIISLWSKEVFALHYAREDGPVEYATAILLFLSSLVLWRNARLLKTPSVSAVGLTIFYGLMFFVAAGEEVSWGQRIFGWQSGEFFVENNYQAETNLHNMVIGEIHLAEQVFGHALSVAILFYLVVLPFIHNRVGFLKTLTKRMAIPVPRKEHAILALFATIVIGSIVVARKWEIYELCFSLFTLSIFLNPANQMLKGHSN